MQHDGDGIDVVEMKDRSMELLLLMLRCDFLSGGGRWS